MVKGLWMVLKPQVKISPPPIVDVDDDIPDSWSDDEELDYDDTDK